MLQGYCIFRMHYTLETNRRRYIFLLVCHCQYMFFVGKARPHRFIFLLAEPDGFHGFTKHRRGRSKLEPRPAIEDDVLAWCRGLRGEVEIKGKTCGLSAGTWCLRLLRWEWKKSAPCLYCLCLLLPQDGRRGFEASAGRQRSRVGVCTLVAADLVLWLLDN
jgi:hypothetical protein